MLDRAEGTPCAGFGARFVERLVEISLADLTPTRWTRGRLLPKG